MYIEQKLDTIIELLQGRKQHGVITSTPEVSINNLLQAYEAGMIISAIKAYRELTGVSLKEAKDTMAMYFKNKSVVATEVFPISTPDPQSDISDWARGMLDPYTE